MNNEGKTAREQNGRKDNKHNEPVQSVTIQSVKIVSLNNSPKIIKKWNDDTDHNHQKQQ
jgi:hypothetical protein